MAQQFIVGSNARVLGDAPNVGVKGLRKTRTDSDALHTFENPQDNLAPKEYVHLVACAQKGFRKPTSARILRY